MRVLQSIIVSLYLIIAPREFEPALASFIVHKEAQGYTVIVEYVDGRSAEQLHAIVEEYSPEYLLLVGDVDNGELTVPSFYSFAGRVTDFHYGIIDDTYIPKVLVGRLPARSLSGAYTMFRNTMYHSYSDNITIALAGEEQEFEHYSWVFSEYFNNNGTFYPNCTLSETVRLVNEGQRFFVYSGHGSWMGSMCYSSFYIPQILFGNYSIVMQLACNGGDFGASVSYGEQWMSQAGRGAVAFIGSSDETTYDKDSSFFVGMMKAYNGGEAILGKIVLAGKQFGFEDLYEYWQRYNLFGDPSLKVGEFYEIKWSNHIYFPLFSY